MAACIAIRMTEQVRKYVEQFAPIATGFYRWLDAHRIPYVPSSANFVLTRLGEHSPEIAQSCAPRRSWSAIGVTIRT